MSIKYSPRKRGCSDSSDLFKKWQKVFPAPAGVVLVISTVHTYQ